jgi:hypothetical protein
MWQNPAFQLDFFRTKIVERLLTDPSNSDHDLYGIYLQHQAMWDAFLLYDYDGRETITPDEKDLSRFTLGAYSAREFAGSFDYIANVAWQGGSAGNFDLSAYLLALELGWNAGGEHDWRAALGIDLASGDDPGDEDFQAYNNLYYTGHKFRGFMDQFLPSNPEGLLDLYLRGSFQPVPDWLAGADLHLFQFAQDPSTVNDERGVGSELDIFARVATMRNFSTEIGGSAFFPNEDTFGADADTELWGYLQFTATLP